LYQALLSPRGTTGAANLLALVFIAQQANSKLTVNPSNFMFMAPFSFNVSLAWLWIVLGFCSGSVLGLNFHRENWLGGYASHQRRLYRLGHISFFGLAGINLLFVFTLQQWAQQTAGVSATGRVASLAFVLGTITMPLCCALAAHKREARSLFAIPVVSLLTGGICTFWEVIHL
jgi:hypothetical protein